MPTRLRRAILVFAAGVIVLGVLAFTAGRYLEARDRPSEATRLVSELRIRPGATVAEIGAGSGGLAIEVARLVGGGQVIATELGQSKLQAIREAAGRAGLSNVTVLAAGEHETNLPAGCGDAIYMQRVYHHLTDPAGVMASARAALKPAGTVGILDFEPRGLRRLWKPRGVPDRGGEGVPREMLVREMQSFGFTLRDDIVAWRDGMYLAVFKARVPAGNGALARGTGNEEPTSNPAEAGSHR